MNARPLLARLHRIIRHSRVLQVGLICAFWLAGEMLVRLSGLPLPGGLVGLAIVLGLLATRGLSIFSMKRGADWFLADMLLFFVPAVLAVLDHREFFGITGLKILFVILLSTAAVMAVTAFTVDLCFRWRGGHARAAPTPR
ncbi:CidA/LrgA family protein [Aureimonas altamirensis]|uniref:CidA/LrgA family protein n=1 Tax=Aureimonas altamirensis TaxID=370622 RepID=UPI001E4AEA74|nr:CidA/LrgA family protein [Aureimonas altamirensis]UHD44084.1 CidA/LrgA family protein [Aureimonas altamirensis]